MQVQGKEKQVILWVVKLKTILPFSYMLYKSFQYSTKQNNYCQNQFQKSKYKTSNNYSSGKKHRRIASWLRIRKDFLRVHRKH